MHALTSLAILAATTLAAAQTCAICPSTIVDQGTTYYFAYDASQSNGQTFCDYIPNPNGPVFIDRVCYYNDNGTVASPSPSYCPATTSTGSC